MKEEIVGKLVGLILSNNDYIIGKIKRIDEESGSMFLEWPFVVKLSPNPRTNSINLNLLPPGWPFITHKLQEYPIPITSLVYQPILEDGIDQSIIQAWYQEATGIVPASAEDAQKLSKGGLEIVKG